MRIINKYKPALTSFPFKSSGIYILNEVFLKGINIAYIPILTRYLAPSDFGVLSTLTSTLSFLLFFIGLNLNNYISVQFSKTKEDDKAIVLKQYFNSFFTILLSITIVLLLVVFLDFAFVNKIFQSRLNAFLIIFIAFFEVLVSFKIVSCIIQDKPKVILKLTLYKNSIDLSFTLLFLIMFHLSYVSRLLGLLISGIFSVGFLRHEFKLLLFKPLKNISNSVKFIKGSISLIPHELSLWLRGGMDRILILNIIGAYYAGIYALAFQLALILAIAASAVNNALIPKIYRYEGVNSFSKNFFSYFKLYSLIILLISLGMFFIFPLVARVFIPSAYEGFLTYYRILLVGFFFKSFYFYFVNTILFRGQTINVSKISMFVSILHFTLMFVFLSRFKLIGTVVLFSFSEFLMLTIVAFFGLKTVKRITNQESA